MRTGAIATAILLLSSYLFAESQEAVYYEALKAEEQGQVSKSIELFERAASIDGPYTDEIKGILEEYYQALGMDKSSLNFRLRGDFSIHGIHYEEKGGYEDVKENGAESFFGVSLFADYTSGTLIHSLGLNFSGNAFLGDTISPLDSTQWTLAPGVEYNLLGESFLICAGVDFKFNPEEWRPLLYGWFEKIFSHMGRNKFGTALSVSEEWDYQFMASLLASWRRFNTRGFNATLFAGPRFATEDVFDYDNWYDDYPEYNVKWLGPYLRGKFSYKFRYNITAELGINLFYRFVLDGPNSDYEKMNKLTGLWGPTLYWSPNIMTFYIGVENAFRRYFDIPDSYEGILSDSMSLWEVKLGAKLDW
jgi:hypothetical protein